MSKVAEVLERNKFYPIVDFLPDVPLMEQRHYRAVYTGQHRCPKKGEYYLSGATIEAYRAPNDISAPYQIAAIVKVEVRTVITIVGEYPPSKEP